MPHRRNIDIDLLRSFVTIIEVKSFTRAAQRLLRTQSAISLQMKRLEEQLDCRLFERGGRGVEPTQAGVLLLGYARRILAANDELVGRMAEPLVEGPVSIGSPEGFGTEQLAAVIARFSRAFPRAHIVVRSGSASDLLADLRDGRLDLLVKTHVVTAAGVEPEEGELLGREALVWCVAEGAEPDLASVSKDQPLPIVLTNSPCPIRAVTEAALATAAIPWRATFETGSRGGVQAAVGAGLGVGVLPRSSMVTGMHRLNSAQGLPHLPDMETVLLSRKNIGLAADRLRVFLLSIFDSRV